MSPGLSNRLWPSIPEPRRSGGGSHRLILAVIAGFLLVAGLVASAAAVAAEPPPPAVTAEAGLLVDLATGQVLYAKNAEGDRAPASLVKLMTLYLAYQGLQAGKVTLQELATVSPEVERTPRFRMGFNAGQSVPFEVLLQGVAIASANDAAVAVAEHLAGSSEAFVGRMNEEAQRMGLGHTVFANPHGLPDPRQRTTARDMAALVEHLLRDFPESREVLGDTEFTWRGRVFRRKIPLFRDPGGVSALKTGYTLEAGYNLAVTAGKAGHRLLCIILGAETRWNSFLEAGRLLKFGFGESAISTRRDGRRWRPRTSVPRVGG